MTTIQQDKEQEIYSNFINSINSDVTRLNYELHLNLFKKFYNLSSLSDLLKIEEPQKHIINYIMSLRQRGLASSSVSTMINAIYHFYDMNDVTLNKKKIKMFIGQSPKKVTDRAYSDGEISKILNVSDLRIENNLWLILVTMPFIFLLGLFQTNNAFGEIVDGLYYSFDIPETWTYTESPESTILADLGVDSYYSIVLVPVEYSAYLIGQNDQTENQTTAIVFARDSEYNIKNAPLDLYVKFKADRDSTLNITSQEDTIVGNEKSVRIESTIEDVSGHVRVIDYLFIT